ncbi:PDR/VanB family oxidoreductase [Pseudarthrobacter sp. YAF2]|uniref:PDR/VanB family oxidoreductase n=1 Tax=Pseudarthrobacter sp. YAF2 TaxID=3233078 RepID=UPI003F9B5D40
MRDVLVVEVAEILHEAEEIRSLRLRKLNGAPFTAFEAGAHVDVAGPTGIVRQYSLASDPRDSSSIMIAIKREPASRGGSEALHQLRVGDHLRIGKPRNLLSIAPNADRHLLVAGGIGVTPLLSMSYELHSRGEEFALHYFARSRDQLAFADFLENRAEFRDRVTIHLGTPRTQLPATLSSIGEGLTGSSHVYTCGPTGFMAKVAETFTPVVGTDHVHIEHFAAEETETSSNRAFDVQLDTGESFEIPADRSILSVLEENGIEVFKSCGEGVCGSCVSGLLEGVPDHRDHCLSEADKAAGKDIALCVSRALSDKLVIELY